MDSLLKDIFQGFMIISVICAVHGCTSDMLLLAAKEGVGPTKNGSLLLTIGGKDSDVSDFQQSSVETDALATKTLTTLLSSPPFMNGADPNRVEELFYINAIFEDTKP